MQIISKKILVLSLLYSCTMIYAKTTYSLKDVITPAKQINPSSSKFNNSDFWNAPGIYKFRWPSGSAPAPSEPSYYTQFYTYEESDCTGVAQEFQIGNSIDNITWVTDKVYTISPLFLCIASDCTNPSRTVSSMSMRFFSGGETPIEEQGRSTCATLTCDQFVSTCHAADGSLVSNMVPPPFI